jgi:hypothetical protein
MTAEPVDLTALAADDALLDALGRGAPASADDPAAALLAAWRAELSADTFSDARPGAAASDGVAVADDAISGSAAASGAALAGGVRSSGAGSGRAGRGRGRRGGRRWAGPGIAAAVLALLGGGLTVAAADATPGSPLWPLTAVVNPGRADVVTTEDKLTQARQAISDGRYADAQRLLDEAGVLVARVRDPRESQRLTAELAAVRRSLADAGTGAPHRSLPTPSPAAPSQSTPRSPASSGSPAPSPHRSADPSGNPLPIPEVSLPGGLLPSLPIPSLPGGLLPSRR